MLASCAFLAGCGQPKPERYAEFFDEHRIPDAGASPIEATFMGVSTILFADQETRLLVDGFFTRPSFDEEEGKESRIEIAPDPKRIRWALARAGIEKLDAVLVVHSHHDHAMDAPEVALQTEAVVVGSRSTQMICKGGKLPDDRFRLVEPGKPIDFGRFSVTFIQTKHGPLTRTGSAIKAMQKEPRFNTIDKPLAPPVRFFDYPEGESYALHITHPAGNIVVQATAGFLRGALKSYPADAIFLGIGRLGSQFNIYKKAYYEETVEAVGAKTIIPVHWDNLTLPLDQPLEPIGSTAKDFRRAIAFLEKKIKNHKDMQLVLMRAFDRIRIGSPP